MLDNARRAPFRAIASISRRLKTKSSQQPIPFRARRAATGSLGEGFHAPAPPPAACNHKIRWVSHNGEPRAVNEDRRMKG